MRNRKLRLLTALFALLLLLGTAAPAAFALDEEGAGMSLEDFLARRQAAPEEDFPFRFELYGQSVDQDTTALTFSNVFIGNEGLLPFFRALPHLPKLTQLRFEYCGTADWALARLRERFPDKQIHWRIDYGWGGAWTDTDTIWAIGGFSDYQLYPLRYCTRVKYLDLGHNGIFSLDFARHMPELEVLIVENDYVSDLHALSFCPMLEYLEVGETRVKDVSPLAACTNLEHLNIGGLPELTDISPLYELPKLKRLYGLCDVRVPQEQVDHITALMPDTEVAFHYDPKGAVNGYHWRYDEHGITERYQLLHDQIGYNW